MGLAHSLSDRGSDRPHRHVCAVEDGGHADLSRGNGVGRTAPSARPWRPHPRLLALAARRRGDRRFAQRRQLFTALLYADLSPGAHRTVERGVAARADRLKLVDDVLDRKGGWWGKGVA